VWQEKAAGTWGVRGELVWPRWDWAPSRGSNACAVNASSYEARAQGVDVRRLQEEKEKVHPRPPGRGATRRRREQGRRSRGRVERRSARAHSPIGFAWSWCWYARQIYRESTRKGTILAITQAGRFRSRAAFFQLQKTKTKRAPPKAAAAGLKQKGGDSFS